MDKQIQVFQFNERVVRTHVDATGNPWWVAADICGILTIQNVGNALARLRDNQRRDIRFADGIGRHQKMACVNESGMYRLLFSSNKPEAEAFTDWVTTEVLPSIRKTGAYSTDSKNWTLARNESKSSRRVETDIIAKFIEYAKEQGSRSAELYYVNFSKMVNAQLLEIEGKAPSDLRDSLNAVQLHSISVAESIIARTLVECMTAKRPYKEVYQVAKSKIEILGEVVGKSKPGISARQYVGLIA